MSEMKIPAPLLDWLNWLTHLMSLGHVLVLDEDLTPARRQAETSSELCGHAQIALPACSHKYPAPSQQL
jgi:hypothetical protein